MYKIPFRDIYCDTLIGWLKELIWVFVILKIYPTAYDDGRPIQEVINSEADPARIRYGLKTGD